VCCTNILFKCLSQEIEDFDTIFLHFFNLDLNQGFKYTAGAEGFLEKHSSIRFVNLCPENGSY
jgi:hypothetical protein